MSKVKVGFVQINATFAGQSYLPYSVGWLQAYAQRFASAPDQLEFALPLFTRMPADDAVQRLLDAEVGVAAFSTYVWNINLSLEIARRFRHRDPDALIVFGGPQVPDKPELFLRRHPFVDIVCHGEGEAVFSKILEQCETRDWHGIPAVSFVVGRPPRPA